jgi:hypothetical protein
MKKRSVPAVTPASMQMAVEALRENVEVMAGRAPSSKIDALPDNADLTATVAKVNEIIALLQG